MGDFTWCIALPSPVQNACQNRVIQPPRLVLIYPDRFHPFHYSLGKKTTSSPHPKVLRPAITTDTEDPCHRLYQLPKLSYDLILHSTSTHSYTLQAYPYVGQRGPLFFLWSSKLIFPM